MTGTYFHEVFNDCLACPSGKFSATGGTSIDGCQDCDAGFISNDVDGAGFCTPCSAGNFSNPTQTACLLCPSGKISGIASTECTDCESGKYSNVRGSEVCTICPNYLTSDPGSTSCRCKDGFLDAVDPITNEPTCTCGPGTTLDHGACVPCTNGFFKSTTSLEACISCNKFAVKNAIQSERPATSPLSCMCSRGDYRVLTTPLQKGSEAPRQPSSSERAFLAPRGRCATKRGSRSRNSL